VESYGCAAYMAVEMAVQRAIFDDELGPLARDYVGTPVAWAALINVLSANISPWWDVAVPGAEPASDPGRRVTEAFDATGVAMRAAFGSPESWTWGNLHQVTFKESTLGSSGLLPLELYFNAQPRAVAGAVGTVNNNYSQPWRAYPDPDDPTSEGVGMGELFDVAGGPSYRLLIDMSDLNGARIVITTGQSGNAFDPHSIDQIPLWLAGDSVSLPFSEANILANAAQTLTLTPR
jgi:penicillin amidase